MRVSRHLSGRAGHSLPGDVLVPSFDVDFLVESRPLARRLHDAGIQIIAADPRRIDTYLKADISPSTCFIVEDNGRRSTKKILSAIRDAGGTLIYVLAHGHDRRRSAGAFEFSAEFPTSRTSAWPS